MQKVDRCTEEVTRLRREADNMCLWFAAEATAIRMALAVPRSKPSSVHMDHTLTSSTDNNLSLRLEQYLTSIERLEARWSCSLITRKHLRETLEQSKAKLPQPATSLSSSSLNRATCSTSIDFLSEAGYDKDDEPLADEARFLEPEAMILSDLLDDIEASDNDLEPKSRPTEVATDIHGADYGSNTSLAPTKSIKDDHQSVRTGWNEPTCGRLATISWVLPVSILSSMYINSHRRFQNDMSIDRNTLPLLRSVQYLNTALFNSLSKDSPRAVGRFSMYPDSISLLRNPIAWLDDVCINACAALLQTFFSAPQLPSCEASRSCAIFSTHDLVRVREDTPDEYFWRQVNATQYWKKPTWIIPIHRPSPESHWVLCIARPHAHVLFLFDSFGHRGSWTRDVEVGHFSILRQCLIAVNRTS